MQKQVIEIILKIYLLKEIYCIFIYIYKIFGGKRCKKFWTIFAPMDRAHRNRSCSLC